MKHDTWVIYTKAACYVAIGIFTPWAASLAQWANSGEWPPRIIWIGVILPASIIGAATQLQSFLSGSYSDYRNKINGSGNPDPMPASTTPPKP